MIDAPFGTLLGAALLCALTTAAPAAALSCAAAADAQPAKTKKKPFGLGGLLKAARNAGVGDILGGGVLGSGKFGQVAGAVAGTAVNASRGDGAPGLTGTMIGLVGSNPIAQIAGAATGTVAELARSAPRSEARPAQAIGSACAADTGAVVNSQK